MSSITLVEKGNKLDVKVNGKAYDLLTVTFSYKNLVIQKDSEILMKTDSVSFIDFGKDSEEYKILENRDDIFRTRVVEDNGSIVLDIESMISLNFWSYIYEDTLVRDYKNNSTFVVRYNPFRFFLPLKMEVINPSMEVDIERAIIISSYLWLKKFMTSHDALN